jgi:hypothetical protein
VQLIRDHSGTCEAGVDVERVLVRSGRAVAVRTATSFAGGLGGNGSNRVLFVA